MTESIKNEKIADKILQSPHLLDQAIKESLKDMTPTDIVELLNESLLSTKLVLEGFAENNNKTASETISQKVIKELTESCQAALVWISENSSSASLKDKSTETIDSEEDL